MNAESKSPLGNGPYCFRIYSQVCHFGSPLYPNEANKAVYGELYIFDSAEAATKRLKTNQIKSIPYDRNNATIGRDIAIK
jgi:hypothetical protein